MAKILSIDASTEACSVALLNDDEVTERYELAPRQHAKLLLPMVDDLLGESGLALSALDAIACHVGPGAFTGVRIAVSLVQALAYGANLPAIALSTLANLAQQGADIDPAADYWCAIDARMDEVYFAAYRGNAQNRLMIVDEERVIAPAEINLRALQRSSPNRRFVLLGSGWTAYRELFMPKGDNCQLVAQQFPRAQAGLKLAEEHYNSGNLLKPEHLQPTYLRNNVAAKQVG